MKIRMDTRDIEDLVIGVLDDDNGISLENYQRLDDICNQCQLQYITKEIRCQNDRYFIPLDAAAQIRKLSLEQ